MSAVILYTDADVTPCGTPQSSIAFVADIRSESELQARACECMRHQGPATESLSRTWRVVVTAPGLPSWQTIRDVWRREHDKYLSEIQRSN